MNEAICYFISPITGCGYSKEVLNDIYSYFITSSEFNAYQM